MAVTLGQFGIVFNDSTTQIKDSSAFESGGLINITTFTSTGTYTIPANANSLLVKCVGGGGGSAGYCESGGAGGYSEGFLIGTVQGVIPGNTVAVTIGAGGGAVGYYAAAGSGGTSSFGSYVSATGGQGANSGIGHNHSGGQGGTGSGGIVSLGGGSGTGHANHHGYSGTGKGGQSFFGGGNGTRHLHADYTHAQHTCAYGAGSAGGCTDSNSQGGAVGQSSGMGGCVVVYAYY